MSLGFGLGLQYSRLSGGGGGFGYNANYQAVIDYANSESLTLPNSTIQNLQNDFAISIKPFFSKFKELHFWSGEAGKSGFKSIDWARLNKADYYNSPTFLERGVKGNGTSSYVDLLFNANTETTIDSLTFGFYTPNAIVIGESPSAFMGGTDSSNNGIFFNKKTNGESAFSVNSTISNSNAKISQGLFSISSDGTNAKLRQGATTLGTETITMRKVTNSVFLLCRNNNGTPFQFIPDTISISFIADELTVTELGILETAIETFLNAI